MAVTWTGYGGSSLLGSTLTMTEGAGSGFYSDPVSGKVYMEFYQTSGLDFMYLGIGGADYPYDWNLRPTEVSYASSAVYDPRTARCGLAVDVSAGKFWIRNEAGNWTTGDPETGSGGYAIPVGFTENRITFGNAGGGAGTIVFDIFTVSGDFTYAVPTGYTALDELPSPTKYYDCSDNDWDGTTLKSVDQNASYWLTSASGFSSVLGVKDKAVKSDGAAGSKLSSPNITDYRALEQTWSCWYKPSSLSGTQAIISNHYLGVSGGDTTNCGSLLFTLGDKLVFLNTLLNDESITDTLGNSTNTMQRRANASTMPLQVDTWYHITTVSTEFSSKLYINGELVVSVTSTQSSRWQNNSVNQDFSLLSTSQDTNNYFQSDGTIDEVYFWNSALTDSEILEHYQNDAVAPTPTVYWQLEESGGTTATDSSANNLDGTYVGSPTLFQDGIIKKSVLFNGSSQYVDLPTSAVLEQSSFSISIWLKTTSTSASTIYSYIPAGSASDGRGLYFRITANGLPWVQWGYGTGSFDNFIPSSGKVNDGGWHNLLLTFTASKVEIFLDGTSLGTDTPTGAINWTDTAGGPTSKVAYIGAEINLSDVVFNHYDGYVDEVKFWNSELTSIQVQEIYTSGTSSLTYSQYVDNLAPVAWYKLDETSGTSAIETIASKDGTHVNTPTLGQNSLITSDLTGKSVLYTEASNNYTTLPYLSDVLATDMSFSLYFNATALDSAWQTILHIGDNTVGGEQGFTVGLDDSNQLSFYWFNGSFRTVAWGEISLSANTTYHLVITVDSTNSEVKAYVDGTLVATKSMPAALILPASAGGFIGANRSSVELFDGRVDDISFYSRLLTSTEVSTLYSKGTDTTNLTYDQYVDYLDPLAHWKLDETSGTTAADSIASRDGTHINTPTLGQNSLVTSDLTGKSVLYNLASTQYTSIADDDLWSISNTGKLSLSFFLKTGSDITTFQGILSKGINTSNEWAVTVFSGNLYCFITEPNGSEARSEVASISPNTTYHIVVNYTGTSSSDEIEIYLDGVKSNSLNGTDPADVYAAGSGSMFIGNMNNSGGDNPLSGTVDDVSLFNRVLTSTEVSSLYSKATTNSYSLTLDSGSYSLTGTDINLLNNTVAGVIGGLSPSGYWPLDDGSAEAVTDNSGNAYDGYWVGVGADEATQDDMLSDGVLGIKPATAAATPTGYMENTAVFALGSFDTGTYTLIAWAKGFNGTDYDVFSWATAQIASTKEYRGKVSVNNLGEVVWNRQYQTGTDIVNDTGYQTASTSGLGLQPDVPYLFALRENATTTEVLVNGSVVISLPRVGTGVNDTTYAPREELRIGNEGIYLGSTTASSYVHGALWNSELSNANILSIYNAWSAIDKEATMASVQSGQTGSGTATKTGTLAITGTMTCYQEDRLTGDGEFISQETNMAVSYTSPDNYIISNQLPQGVVMQGTSTGDPLTVRYSTHGITTSSDSTPADTPIAPRLLNAGNYKNEIDIRDVGVVTPSFGQIILDNTDGALDGLVDKAFDGGSYKLYYGPKNGKFPDDFTKVVDTVMGKPTFDHRTVKVQLKDKMDFLDQPFVEASFTGTGNINGTSIVKGEPKQRIVGRVWGAPVQLIDAEKLIYWVCDDEMATDNITSNNNTYSGNQYRSPPNAWNDSYANLAYGRVFDGGTQITNGQDYVTEADLFSIEPAAGTVRWYRPSGFRGPVMFRLGSSPAADVRVDVETTPSGSSNWSLNDIIAERPEIDVSAGSTNVSLVRGFFVNDNSFTYKDAVKEFMKKDFYFARFDRNGEFKVSQVATPDPAATPLYEFNEANMANIVIDQVTPAWKLYINSGEAIGGQVNTGVPDARKDEFTETPYHTIAEYEEPATRSRHKLSDIIDVSTKSWWNDDDVSTHSDLAKVFLMEDRVRLTVTIDKGHINSTTLLLDVGDTVSVKMPRYNYDLGKNFIVHGVRHDYQQGRLTFTLWG